MKRKISLIICAVLVLSGFAYSLGNYQNIGVYFGAVNNIFVNNVDKTSEFKDPFIYNGTTYVSLRDVSEALGEQVSWDEETRSIYIGDRPRKMTIESTLLTTLPMSYYYNLYLYRINNRVEPVYNMDQNAQFDYPAGYQMRISRNANDLVGDVYNEGMSLKVSDGATALYYKLKKDYTVLKGRVGFDTILNEYSYEKMIFRIKNDLDVIEEYTISSDKPYVDFNVPVIGVSKLVLDFELQDGDDIEPFVNLVDVVLEEHIYN